MRLLRFAAPRWVPPRWVPATRDEPATRDDTLRPDEELDSQFGLWLIGLRQCSHLRPNAVSIQEWQRSSGHGYNRVWTTSERSAAQNLQGNWGFMQVPVR